MRGFQNQAMTMQLLMFVWSLLKYTGEFRSVNVGDQ
jgi:hypothetical protein